MSVDILLDLFLALCGAYLAYSAYEMKKTGEIKTGVMVSKNITIKPDADKAGFIAYMFPRTVLVGVLTFICGCIGLVNDFYGGLSNIFLGIVAVFFVAIILYGVFVSKAQKKYLQ